MSGQSLRNKGHWVALLLLIFLASSGTIEAQSGAGPALNRPNRLCSLLENIQPGDRLPVILEGELSQWWEFKDPREPLCQLNVGQVTGSEWRKGFEVPQELQRIFQEHGRAYVVLVGEFLGPKSGAKPNPDISPLVDYSSRFPNGHFVGSDTKLIVHKLVEMESPLELHQWPLTIFDTTPFPEVIEAAMPLSYPFMAHKVGFSGDVKVQLTIEKGQVVKAEVLEGDHLLTEDTLANVRTWKFDSTVDARFTTTFIYRLERKPPEVSAITVRAQMPVRIEIVAPFHIR